MSFFNLFRAFLFLFAAILTSTALYNTLIIPTAIFTLFYSLYSKQWIHLVTWFHEIIIARWQMMLIAILGN